MTGNTGRIHSIDIMKGICILFVVFTHYSWTEEIRLKMLFPFWIDMAVPVFMILSGFVYTKSFKKNQYNSLRDGYRPIVLVKRIIRFIIPFLFIYLIELMLLVILEQKRLSIKEMIVLFVKGGLGPGSYYFPLLIQFVFVFPIVYILILKFKSKGLVCCMILNFLYEVIKLFFMNEGIYRLLVFRYITVIAFGCYIAMYELKIHPALKAGMGLIGIVHIILFEYLTLPSPIMTFWTGTSMIACFYIIPIVAKLIEKKNCINAPLELIGKASFNIFLIQMIYYRFFAEKIYSVFGGINLDVIISILICVTVGIAFYFVENPLTAFVIKCIDGRQRKVINE